MTRIKPYLALALLLGASGCYTTSISSGKPLGKVAPDADDTWHSGLVTGGVDLSGDYDLKRLCPKGWAEIRTETSVLNEVVELATYRLYAPQTVRVTCAAGAPRPPRARGDRAQPLARARQSTVSKVELGDSNSARIEILASTHVRAGMLVDAPHGEVAPFGSARNPDWVRATFCRN